MFIGNGGLLIIPPGGPPGPMGLPGVPGPPGITFPVGPNNNYHATLGVATAVAAYSIPSVLPNQQYFIWSYFQAINDSDVNSWTAGFIFGAFVNDFLGVTRTLGVTGQVFNGSNPSPSVFIFPAGLTIDIFANNIGAPSPSDFQIQTFVMNVTSPNIP